MFRTILLALLLAGIVGGYFALMSGGDVDPVCVATEHGPRC